MISLLVLKRREDLKTCMGFGEDKENILDVMDVQFFNEVEDCV
jgi:hypothetical protein